MAYGMAPVMTGGVMALVLAGGLLFGGGQMVSQMADGPAKSPGTAAPTTPGGEQTASPTQSPGSTGEPTSPTGEPAAPETSDPTGSPSDPGQADPSNPTTPPGHSSDPEGWERNANGDVVHRVVVGDTLSKISAKYGVSVDRIAEYNSIRDVNLIYADSALEIQVLRIPSED